MLLVGLMILSGCGSNSASPAPNQAANDKQGQKVEIELLLVTDANGKHVVVTNTNANTAKKLLDTIQRLPAMPKEIACTDELGPAYNLKFYDEGKLTTTARAERYGCRPVTIQGKEEQTRQSNQEFWDVLDNAILQATPAAHVTQLAILHTTQPDKVGRSALLPVATAQRLYEAIVKLPLVSMTRQKPCTVSYAFKEYDMVFTAANELIEAVPDAKNCHQISLGSGIASKSKSGLFQMDAQFERLLSETLEQGKFETARPDQLSMTVFDYKGTTQQIKVTDAAAMQKLFEKTYSLPSVKTPQYCITSEDKMAQRGTSYTLHFSQWNLELQDVIGFRKVGCQSDWSNNITSRIFQGDDEFWKMVLQVAGDKSG